MKKYFVFLLILLLPSCISDEVVTTVFRSDGSFTRVVEFISDKKDFNTEDLATPVDSTWKITVVRDTADTSRYRVRAEKAYTGVEQLNEDYRTMTTALEGVKRELSFEKKFMWFYTFYYYQETVYGMLSGRPVHDYLTDEELHYLQSDKAWLPPSLEGKDSTVLAAYDQRVQTRFQAWLGNSLFDLWWTGMKQVVTDHPSGSFTPARLLAAEDSLRTVYLKAFQDMIPGRGFSGYFTERFGISADTLEARYPAAFERYEKITGSSVILASYKNRVVMPGKVYDTNADRMEEGKMVWSVNAVRFLPGDLDMFAASRVPNYWAWLIAFFVIIFAAVMFFPKRKEY
jgi:hypothetical protein